MQQDYIDFRSIDRVSGESNDFVLQLPPFVRSQKVSSVNFSNMELPSVRHTVEDKENALAISEGIYIGDDTMQNTKTIFGHTLSENQILLRTSEGDDMVLTLPASLMPIQTFQLNKTTFNEDGSVARISSVIETPQSHGLETFLSWNANPNINILLVGAEPNARVEKYFRAGIMVNQLPSLRFEDTSISFSPHTIDSIRVGSHSGYLHCPPLHLQEIISLLNHAANGSYTFSLSTKPEKNKSILRVSHKDKKRFAMFGVNSAQSLYTILGLTSSVQQVEQYGKNNPSVMRLRVPTGFYQSPPSLMANAIERSLQNRCNLNPTAETVDGHSFSISIFDATYNQQIVVPIGVYTPEKLVDAIQSLCTDVNISIEHISDIDYENVGWIRYTFSSVSDFPFSLDFSGKKSSAIAFALGFENKRYSSQRSYVGTSFAVSASRNIAPCPSLSATTGLRAPIQNIPSRTSPRYPHGLYTIIGTSPNIQKFQLVCEPGKSWAVPNKLRERTFFHNIEGKGIIDLTTRALPKQLSYDFREGDIVRLTGYHKFEQTFSISAQSISGPGGHSSVTNIYSDNIGGRGYSRPPTVRLTGELTEPREFHTNYLVVQPPTSRYLLDVTAFLQDIQNVTATKILGNTPTITLTILLQPNSPIFDTQNIANNVSMTVEEFMPDNSVVVHTIHPGDFTIENNSLNISPSTGLGQNNATDFLCNITFNALIGSLSFACPTQAFTINTIKGTVQFQPFETNSTFFVFQDHKHMIGAYGEERQNDGESCISVDRETPLVDRLLQQLHDGDNISFSQNRVGITNATVRSFNVEERLLKVTTPNTLLRSGTYVTSFAPTIYATVNHHYQFECFSLLVDGIDTDTFSPTLPGQKAYQLQTIPETVSFADNTYAGIYSHTPQPWNMYVYSLNNIYMYLYSDANGHGWRLSGNLLHTNTSHPLYGENLQIITQNDTKAVSFTQDATVMLVFSDSQTVAGTIVVLSDETPLSLTFETTALRPSGMVHPTLQPVMMNGRVVCYNVSNTGATYLYPPSVEISDPSQKPGVNDPLSTEVNTIQAVSTTIKHNPERLFISLQLSAFPPELKNITNIGEKGFVAAILDENGNEHLAKIVHTSEQDGRVIGRQQLYKYEMKVGYDGSAEYGFDGVGANVNDRFGELSPNKQILGYTIKALELKNNRFKLSVDTTNKENPKRCDIKNIYLVDKDSQRYTKKYSIANIDKFQDTGDTVKWYWNDDINYWEQRVGKHLEVIIEVEKISEKPTVILSKDYYESTVPAWISTSKSFRIVPGRAIHLNHTTLTNGNSNYCHPCMTDLITKQQFWGQEIPLTYSDVVPIQNGFVDTIQSISTTGVAETLTASVVYEHALAPKNIETVEKQMEKPVVFIVHSHGQLEIKMNDIINLYVHDHISLVNTSDETIVENATITSFNFVDSSIKIDTDPSTTPYWHETTYPVTDVKVVVNTRRFVLDASFDYRHVATNDLIYIQGTTEDTTLSENKLVSGFYRVDRYSSIIENNRSQLYLNYPHVQTSDIDNAGTVTTSSCKVRLTSPSAITWSEHTNGVRLQQQNGTLDGIFQYVEISTTEIDISAEFLKPSDVGNTTELIKQGEITVNKIPSNHPPLVAGEKIVISGTTQEIPNGPYTGTTSLSFGHGDGRSFDGVWTVKDNETNNSFTLQYDSAFLMGEYTDPNSQDVQPGIPTSYSRATIGRVSNVGTHDFSEAVFCRGYDILNDSTWRLRIFNTANPSSSGIGNIGVGGFVVYNPAPVRAHAIAHTTGDPQNYTVSSIMPAIPGFVSKHDDPSTTDEDIISPPLKIGYAEGITSQLNTQFTGAEPPQGHAKASANIHNGHIVPNSHLPSGTVIEGHDEDGNPLSYNIVSMYIPGRMTYESINQIPRTLMNIHRLRLVLSKPYNVKFHGPIAISGDEMIKGAYNRSPSIQVHGAQLDVNGTILCTGGQLPESGDVILSPDLSGTHHVGTVNDLGNGTYTVEMYPTQNDFVGVTSVTFEDVNATVAYDYNAATVNYTPVSNSNLGSSNDTTIVGKYVNVPSSGTKTSTGGSLPTYDDGRYFIPPRVEGQEIEIISGNHTTAYAAYPNAPSTPNNFFAHMTHGVESAIGGNTQIFSWGPISNNVSDSILSVPTVCFPGSQNLYFTSDMNITYGGDYTAGPTAQFHADASMTIVNENQTRIGIVTLTDFDPHNKFRIIFEYNPNGLRNGKGFDDVTKDGNVFLTFSRVMEPRIELLPENTDAMAVFGSPLKRKDMVFSYDVRNLEWPDTFIGPPKAGEVGHSLLPRQKQNVGTLIGATNNLFGKSSYILPSQWNIEPQVYRLLVIEPFSEVFTAHTALCTAVDNDADGTISLGEKTNNTKIFMKIPIPSAYNVSGPQPRQFSLLPAIYLNKLRIRILDFDMTPHPLHGREMTISLIFDKGKSVGQRRP